MVSGWSGPNIRKRISNDCKRRTCVFDIKLARSSRVWNSQTCPKASSPHCFNRRINGWFSVAKWHTGQTYLRLFSFC